MRAPIKKELVQRYLHETIYIYRKLLIYERISYRNKLPSGLIPQTTFTYQSSSTWNLVRNRLTGPTPTTKPESEFLQDSQVSQTHIQV